MRFRGPLRSGTHKEFIGIFSSFRCGSSLIRDRSAAVAEVGQELAAEMKKKLMIKQEVQEKSMWISYYNVSNPNVMDILSDKMNCTVRFGKLVCNSSPTLPWQQGTGQQGWYTNQISENSQQNLLYRDFESNEDYVA